MGSTFRAALCVCTLSACGSSSADGSGFVVKANGETIGYVLEATDYLLTVFDPDNSILFVVNDATGFVTSRIDHWYFANEDCSGQPQLRSIPQGDCLGSEPEPVRRWVVGRGGDQQGFSRASGLYVATGVAQWGSGLVAYERWGSCEVGDPGALCAYTLGITTAIPPAFELPITVEAP